MWNSGKMKLEEAKEQKQTAEYVSIKSKQNIKSKI